LICAFISNAASFVLPISNPANFVVFGLSMPPRPDGVMSDGFRAVACLAPGRRRRGGCKLSRRTLF
jgi:hypothetical protein